MTKTKEMRIGLLRSALFAGVASSTVLAGTPTSGDLFFTRYSGTPNVAKVGFVYDGTTATLGATVNLASLGGADGIIFHPNGDLLIGGQGPTVYQITTGGAAVSSGNAINNSYHLALDPSATKVWTSDFGGDLVELPLSPNVGNGTLRNVTGDDQGLTQLAFAPSGKVFYVDGAPNGGGSLGVIDMTTFVTDQFKAAVESAHGMVYDAFTGLMTLFGRGRAGSFDPASATPETTIKESALLNSDFDQGAVDGNGHALVAGGNAITFIDYSVSHDITNPDYVKVFGGFGFIDDVAPLSGLGSTPTPTNGVPDASSFLVATTQFAGVFGMLALMRRKTSKRS